MSAHDEIEALKADDAHRRAETTERYGAPVVSIGDLIDQAELAFLLGWSESSLRAARAQPERHRKLDLLPEPIGSIGRSPVWDARQVLNWLADRHGWDRRESVGQPYGR